MKWCVLLSSVALLFQTMVAAETAMAEQKGTMQHPGMNMKPETAAEVTRAAAVVSSGNGVVHGLVTFEKTDKGLRIVADIAGLTPGRHGFHIHEFGDCSSADYTSAGGHFMMPGESHGAPDDPDRHKGDLGNLEADASGHAHMEWVDPGISFYGSDSILGRSVVIHEKEDDLKSQPAGDSGPRIACGVIGIAKPL
jgi:Cu-Zn family superoxide dismutase